MMKQSRPASIIITQILMMLSSVVITLGFTYALLRTLFTAPHLLLSFRAVGFYALALGLPIAFIIYGVGGLWKRKRYGYWMGLAFLIVVNAKNIYSYAPGIYKSVLLIVEGPHEANYLQLGYRSEGLVIFDLVVQGFMLILMLVLLLKVAFGSKEKKFFDPPSEAERA